MPAPRNLQPGEKYAPGGHLGYLGRIIRVPFQQEFMEQGFDKVLERLRLEDLLEEGRKGKIKEGAPLGDADRKALGEAAKAEGVQERVKAHQAAMRKAMEGNKAREEELQKSEQASRDLAERDRLFRAEADRPLTNPPQGTGQPPGGAGQPGAQPALPRQAGGGINYPFPNTQVNLSPLGRMLTEMQLRQLQAPQGIPQLHGYRLPLPATNVYPGRQQDAMGPPAPPDLPGEEKPGMGDAPGLADKAGPEALLPGEAKDGLMRPTREEQRGARLENAVRRAMPELGLPQLPDGTGMAGDVKANMTEEERDAMRLRDTKTMWENFRRRQQPWLGLPQLPLERHVQGGEGKGYLGDLPPEFLGQWQGIRGIGDLPSPEAKPPPLAGGLAGGEAGQAKGPGLPVLGLAKAGGKAEAGEPDEDDLGMAKGGGPGPDGGMGKGLPPPPRVRVGFVNPQGRDDRFLTGEEVRQSRGRAYYSTPAVDEEMKRQQRMQDLSNQLLLGR